MAETRIENSGRTSSARTPAELAMRTRLVSSPSDTITFSMRGSWARAARSARSMSWILSRISRPSIVCSP